MKDRQGQMSAEAAPSIKEIRVLNAGMCNACPFAYLAEVLMSSGRTKKMIYCARKDCDNWLLAGEAAPWRT